MSETVRMFFDDSKVFPPAAKSLLTIQEVDSSLTRLAQLTKEDEQQSELEEIAKKYSFLNVYIIFLSCSCIKTSSSFKTWKLQFLVSKMLYLSKYNLLYIYFLQKSYIKLSSFPLKTFLLYIFKISLIKLYLFVFICYFKILAIILQH